MEAVTHPIKIALLKKVDGWKIDRLLHSCASEYSATIASLIDSLVCVLPSVTDLRDGDFFGDGSYRRIWAPH
jgi:hypothetical protein